MPRIPIVTNGIYRSIEHRATVDTEKERLSIATFYNPNVDAQIGPVNSLITEETPALYRTLECQEYFKGLFGRKLDGKAYIDAMKLDSAEH
ncbi:putative 2-oxoglutarate/Fe(II)-dependent dioxygenase [Morus notabilis]|uniref:Putative 2-oxoglutarate/Fe(II)-dependent dioxygenase n=1 Tax=Morus notabilis TaxID=981085 RepID=W9SJG3_9ROSA|nr:putative 2-oxoglutarate/Fe(II)-dependent dioxygenase [Morus notabilis]